MKFLGSSAIFLNDSGGLEGPLQCLGDTSPAIWSSEDTSNHADPALTVSRLFTGVSVP